MGYAGYAPGKYAPELNEYQRALKAVTSAESLEVIGKVIYNIACMPKEEKYRSLKLTNDKIKRLIVDTPGAMAVLTELGWEDEDGVLVCKRNMTMAQFKDVETAKDNLRKDIRRDQVGQMRANAKAAPAPAAPGGISSS